MEQEKKPTQPDWAGMERKEGERKEQGERPGQGQQGQQGQRKPNEQEPWKKPQTDEEKKEDAA